MRLIRLELENYCNHGSLTVDFKPGMTAILGRNGSGKSNCLDAVRWLLTGLTENAGNKSANVRYGIGKKQRSRAQLSFEHGGVRGTVIRQLSPASPARLEWSTGEVITGEAEVTAILQELMGVDKQTIQQVVIVAQTDIFGFITQTDAARATYFQSLFGIQHLDDLHEHLKAYVRTINTQFNWQTEIDAKLATLAATNAELVQFYQANMDIQFATNPYDADIQLLTRQAEWLSASTAGKTRVSQLQAAIAQDSVLKHQADETCETARAGIAKVSKQLLILGDMAKHYATLETARRLMEVQKQRDTVQAELLRLETERQTFSQDLLVIAAFGEHAALVKVEETQSMFSSVSQEIARLSKYVTEAVCPTCLRPHDNVEHLEQHKATIVSLETTKVKLAQELTVVKQQYSDVQRVYAIATSYDNCQKQLMPLQLATVADEDVEYANSRIELANQLNLAITQQKEILDTANRDNDVISRRLLLNRSLLAEQNAQLTQLAEKCGSLDFSEVSARLAELQAKSQNWLKAMQTLAVFTTKIETLEYDIQTFRDRKAQQEKNDAWISLVEKVGGLFHREGVSRYVSFQNLQLLEQEMNRILEFFATAYRLRAIETLTFEADFFDGSTQPVARLSGGQRTVVAMAFRLAMHMLFARGVGLLMLDEPTAFLDEQHMQAFAPVLTNIREYASSHGLQCIIVTHAREIAQLCDQTIQIGA